MIACFTGGMWALASELTDDPVLKLLYRTNGAEITRTCHESYERSRTVNFKLNLCSEAADPTKNKFSRAF